MWRIANNSGWDMPCIRLLGIIRNYQESNLYLEKKKGEKKISFLKSKLFARSWAQPIAPHILIQPHVRSSSCIFIKSAAFHIKSCISNHAYSLPFHISCRKYPASLQPCIHIWFIIIFLLLWLISEEISVFTSLFLYNYITEAQMNKVCPTFSP